MAGGSGALGFGSGFATGIANVLGERRKERLEKERRDEENKYKYFQAIAPHAWESARETGDYESVQRLFTDTFPDLEKSFRKTGINFTDLGPLIHGADRPAATVGSVFETGQGTLMPTVEGAGPDFPDVPPTMSQRQSFFGQPMLTEEQSQEKAVTGKVALARRMLPQLQAADPTATMDDALATVGIRTPSAAARSAANQSIAGELADGTPAFGVFHRESGTYLDPATGKPLDGFRPRTTTASTSLGQLAERAAKELGFANATAAARAGKMAEVNAKVQALQEAEAQARGTGTGRAKITTELNSPIGPTAAGLYNVSPTTTLGQLGSTVTLRPDQQEKVASLSQVDQLLDEIATALPKVYPEVDPGVWGRLQTQFSLGAQKLSADEDLAALDAAVNAALAQVAQLSGQPGSRLSDRDVALARSTLAELTPKVFGGDTLRTAKARLGVVRRLLEKAKTSVPTGGRPVLPATGSTPGAWVIIRNPDGTFRAAQAP